LTSVQEELSQTKTQLEAAQAELDKTKAELQTQTTELNDTQTQLQTAQAKLSDTQTALASAKDTLAQTQAELESTQAKLNETEQQWQTTQEALSQTQNQYSEASDAAQKMSQELANVQTELSSARSQLQSQAEVARQQSDQLATLQKQASEMLQETIANGAVAVEPQPHGVLLRIGGSVLFGGGQATIRSAGHATLDDIAEFLQRYPDYPVRVEGYTDSLPVSSDSRWASNWELSTARAAAAVRYLESKGVDVNRMSAGGYAEYRPLADNETREGRAKNRRIEIVLATPTTADASQ